MEINMIEKFVESSDGIHTLAGRVYVPEGEIKGFFHVVHGMTEHIARYDLFMREIASTGRICFGYDNLGHGRTAKDKTELGYIAKKDGWKYLASDVKIFSDEIRKEYGENLPYILMGHSMGSFIVRTACEMSVKPDKLIIMGTGGPNAATGIGLFILNTMIAFKGDRYISSAADKLMFGSFNDGFDNEGPSAWLSCDENARKAYHADEFCTFKFTLGALRDLVKLNSFANSGKWFSNFDKKIPVLLVSGADDPVGNYGKGVTVVYNKLLKKGVDARMHLYESGRHEILNDDTHDAVVADILSFLEN